MAVDSVRPASKRPLLRLFSGRDESVKCQAPPRASLYEELMSQRALSYLCTASALAIICRILPLLSRAVSGIGGVLLFLYLAHLLAQFVLFYFKKTRVDVGDKAVLITGCDTGFGNKLARRLTEDGVFVYAGCLYPDGSEAKKLSEDCGSRLKVLKMDVTRADDVDRAFRELERTLNGKGPKGHFTYPGFVGYSMSKHAMVSFADGLRREMKKWGVKVITVEPGLYRTRMTTEDAVNKGLDNNWQKTPDIVKESYGQDYFEAFRKSLLKAQQTARTNILEVIETLQEAVLVENPNYTYRCAGIKDLIRFWFMSILPTPVMDILFCLILQPNTPLESINKSV
ncbi:17-beta-hydroxysteroid dehydrogenase type 6-like isoform X4 [Centruroides sculpturatus]|uniref:17-beta-hydroxysteroid dehydrogenase type 6-like isoform X4 n=1 Tax=Centruroides sculpturatus TaxID=218467 RepID=UPI000C6D485F|nr:17-beta-hydroxysteroid dehydrogenase type 6-like isoform X4 [Centruroides sculpturatus]